MRESYDTYDDYEPEDDDVEGSGAPDPVDTLAAEYTPNQVVKDRIAQVKSGTANDPSTPNPIAALPPAPVPQSMNPSPMDLAAMQYAHGVSQDASVGRALNSLASGFGAKVDNSGYDAMAKEAGDTANKTLDRSAKIAQAIAAQKIRQDALTAKKGSFDQQFGERVRHNKAMEDSAGKRADASGDKPQASAMKSTIALLEGARGNPAAQQAEKDIYAAAKINRLFDKVGDLDKLSPEMANLAVVEVAKMGSGATPDDHMLNMLNPAAYRGTLAKAWEKVSNKPTPANAGAFLKQYKEYADGMTEDAKQLIQSRYGRIIDSNADAVGEGNTATLKKNYIDRFAPPPVSTDPDKAGASFPKTVVNPQTGKVATVSNAQEEKEAQAEGFR